MRSLNKDEVVDEVFVIKILTGLQTEGVRGEETNVGVVKGINNLVVVREAEIIEMMKLTMKGRRLVVVEVAGSFTTMLNDQNPVAEEAEVMKVTINTVRAIEAKLKKVAKNTLKATEAEVKKVVTRPVKAIEAEVKKVASNTLRVAEAEVNEIKNQQRMDVTMIVVASEDSSSNVEVEVKEAKEVVKKEGAAIATITSER